jgi:hypothetical protein
MDGNDQYGDCTIAALAHAITVYRGLIGQKTVMTKTSVDNLYFKLTGGSDSGLNELDVLNYWHKHSIDKDKILAFVSIDPKNHSHVELANWLFGGVYLGFQVQANCINEFNARTPWIPGTLTNEGHAVYAINYDSTGVTVLTWGNTQKATWPWWDECVDECYAILPPEAENTGFAPGFNYAQLQSDLNML